MRLTAPGAVSEHLELLVDRPRLLEAFAALDAGSQVVAIWAPAGSGKTALLQQFCGATTSDVVWADAARGEDLARAVRLVRDAAPGSVTLVVDRVDLADERALAVLVEALDGVAPLSRVVLAGRYDPLPVDPARWAVTHELRAADLAFVEGETADLLARSQVFPDADALSAVQTRTQGWATGLVLLSHVLAGGGDVTEVMRNFDGDQRAVADYLVSELLDHLLPRERQALLDVAVCPKLPVELAATLSTDPAIIGLLVSMARRNSLITSREQEEFTFHPILATYLLGERLRRDHGAALEGHRAAAAWFSAHGDGAAALEQARLAHDPELLERMLREHSRGLVFGGEARTVMTALYRLPTPAGALDAEIRLLLSLPTFSDRLRSRHRIQARGLSDVSAVDATEDPLGLILAVAWAHAQGDEHAARRLAEPELVASAAADDGSGGLLILLEIARIWTGTGADADGRIRAGERLAALAAAADSPELCWLRMMALDGALLLWSSADRWEDAQPLFVALAAQVRADIDPADTVATRVVFTAAGNALNRGLPLPTRALGRIASREYAAVEPTMYHGSRMLLALERLDREPGRSSLEALTAVMDGEAGEFPQALGYAVVPWLRAAAADGDASLVQRILGRSERVLGTESLELVLARFMLHPERDTEARLREAVVGTSPKWSPLSPVYGWVVLASHADLHQRVATATDDIRSALSVAAPLGAVRPFLLDGGTPASLVRSRLERLAQWRDLAEAVLAADRRLRPAGAEAERPNLTPRERELLAELPAYQSVGEIAAQHQVSVNTVKSQLQSLYRKLGVNGRARAVEIARQRGLL